jgi:U3 small nucleolar RNA-associated protein 12
MYTPDYTKYAVSLQNCQIHLFFADTGKPFLKLYGHKLPITHFDISSDNALLVSCSVDKDIRLWDMDFGHCIKSIFAH